MRDGCVGCGATLNGAGTIHDPCCAFNEIILLADGPRRRTAIIDRFRGNFRCFSNFFVEPDGTHVEGEYQSSKCADGRDIQRFVGLSPRKAKALGNTIRLRPDWTLVNLRIMEDLVRRKFLDHPELARILLSTGDAELVEGNQHGDDFWGTVDGVGQNHLGKILMRVRDLLRSLGGDLEDAVQYRR